MTFSASRHGSARTGDRADLRFGRSRVSTDSGAAAREGSYIARRGGLSRADRDRSPLFHALWRRVIRELPVRPAVTRFVLIPGAWLGAWCWKNVVPALEKAGHSAYPVTLTGMGERVHLVTKDVGMETAVQDVLNVVRFNELQDYVLVGHSFAGKVAAAVADRAPKAVRNVIYLDAIRPERVREPQAGFDPSSEFGPLDASGLGVPLTKETIARIGPDVAGENLRWMLALATPWPVRLGQDPISLSAAYDRVKEAYVFCRQSGDPVDEIVAGKWGKLEGPHRVLDTGHWPMVTKPEALARELAALAL